MLPVGFEPGIPASKRPQNSSLRPCGHRDRYRAFIVMSLINSYNHLIHLNKSNCLPKVSADPNWTRNTLFELCLCHVSNTYVGYSISKLQIQVSTYVFELSAGNCHRYIAALSSFIVTHNDRYANNCTDVAAVTRWRRPWVHVPWQCPSS
jgi:hypothetical protein